jgi:hypothetical protein
LTYGFVERWVQSVVENGHSTVSREADNALINRIIWPKHGIGFGNLFRKIKGFHNRRSAVTARFYGGALLRRHPFNFILLLKGAHSTHGTENDLRVFHSRSIGVPVAQHHLSSGKGFGISHVPRL